MYKQEINVRTEMDPAGFHLLNVTVCHCNVYFLAGNTLLFFRRHEFSDTSRTPFNFNCIEVV